MENDDILKILKRDPQPKAPVGLKQNILNAIQRKEARQYTPSKGALGAFTESWIFLVCAILGLYILNVPNQAFVIFEKEFQIQWHGNSLRLFVILTTVLFCFSMLPIFYPFKRKTLE